MSDILYFSVNKNRIFIHRRTEEQFMLYNPPCKNCLVKSMCLVDTDTGLYKSGYELIINNGCKEVFEFLENHNKKKSEKYDER